MTPILRHGTSADASAVADLLISTRTTFMPYAPSPHTEDEVRSWVASHLVPKTCVTVAQIQGQVVGVIATETDGETSWIAQMAVQPSLVGSGIGSTLLRHAIQSLSLPVRLYTFQQNAGARRFYERHGFVAVEYTDGQGNEERCPDVMYELKQRPAEA